MSSGQPEPVRRLQLTLKKPFLSAFGGIKPTVVIDGRGYPGQWGTGTWQIPSDAQTVVGIYLFNRLWKFGTAQYWLNPDEPAELEYRAGLFGAGRIVAPPS